MSALMSRVLGQPLVARLLSVAGPALGVLAVHLIFFGDSPARVWVTGAVSGLLAGLIAIGMALIYRANRIINFAQADLGTVPTVLVVGIVVFSGLPWMLGLAAGLLGAAVLGAVVEFVLVRRFFKAPRLILTVATIGIGQLLAVGALLLPRLWDRDLSSQRIPPPFDYTFSVGQIRYDAGTLLALIIAPLAMAAVALLLRYTSIGIAVRASAERADRAGSLGIPVSLLQTLVWSIAGVLAFLGVFLRAGITPLPVVAAVSLTALLAPLAALMLGRMTNLPAVALSAVALGVLEQGVVYRTSNEVLVFPVLGAVILGTLVLRRRSLSRAAQDDTSSWQATAEVRPIPAELRRIPEVAGVRLVGFVLLGLVALLLPLTLGVGNTARLTAVVIYAIITLSIVVLTGWAGQVSLGQMSLVGIGAAVGAVATARWEVDLSVAMVAAGLAGAAVALVIGLPALRLRGLYLAVTTLAFALAASNYLLSRRYFNWIPGDALPRGAFLGSFDLSSERAMYYLSLVTLVASVLAVGGIRRSRSGRVLLAVRENERAAQAFGISVVRAKLSAFAMSGFLAGVAGCLLVHLSGRFDEFAYAPTDSIRVFTAAVVGGLGSPAGALLGAFYLQGAQWFLPSVASAGETAALVWALLPTSIGVLVVLLLFPGGLGGLVYKVRDLWLRSVARRHDLVVPSLIADVRVEPESDPLASFAPDGEHAVEIPVEQRLIAHSAAAPEHPTPVVASDPDEQERT